MRIHYILHAAFEKLGAIETWATHHHHSMTGTLTYAGASLPDVFDFDLLIVMGGPQSPAQVDQYPYLLDEIHFIKHAISLQKRVLGVCLGAQLISEALGSATLKSPYKEIGMFDVDILAAGRCDPVFSQFENPFAAMHWHSDMPGMPDGARLLASSAGCPHQAYVYGDRVYGLQFHLELTQPLVQEMIYHCPDDLAPDQYVASKAALLASDFKAVNDKLYVILDYLASVR